MSKNTTSKVNQIKEFAEKHKGEKFTATGLAKALGWYKEKIKTAKTEEGKSTIKLACYNSKAAIRLVKKCGATVSKSSQPSGANTPPVVVFDIVL